jgi:hypothetical protein
MEIMQSVKDNPWKIMLGSSSTIIALVGALFAVDARYAHAADVEKDKSATFKAIQDTANTLRRQMLEDKLFEIDITKAQSKNQQLSPINQALRDRYQRQLDELGPTKKQPAQ